MMRLGAHWLAGLLLGNALIAPAGAQALGRLDNGRIALTFHIPDPAGGFYRGTRFDWSGMIASLTYRGQSFYGPWYNRIDPAVRDFRDDGTEIVVGPNSSAMGPSEEFVADGKALGFDTAGPGGTFLKIGVGLLRRPDDKSYDQFRAYEIVDGGTWRTRAGRTRVTFTQTLADHGSGYGYVYRKTLALLPGKPMLSIGHSLRNTGRLPLRANVYDHNFLVTAGHHTGPDFVISAPFAIAAEATPRARFAQIDRTRIHFLKPLEKGESVFMPFTGFGASSADNVFRVENVATGQGFTVEGDRPLTRAVLWSIRSTISLEPFVAVAAEPGRTARWNYRYTYFAR